MVYAIIAARLLVSAVLLIAGAAKLMDRGSARQTLRDFGVPEWFSSPLGVLLPVAELAIGLGLLPAQFAWLASAGALSLFGIFIVAIGVNLVRGRRPSCNCFGKLHSKPIGWDLVARNAGLCLAAGLVLSAGPSQPGILGADGGASWGLAATGLALLIGMANLWLMFQVMQQNGRLLARLDEIEKRSQAPARKEALVPLPSSAVPPAAAPPGLPVGQMAPAFTLSNLDGAKVSLDDLRDGVESLLLVFVNPDCGPCTALLPKLEAWQDQMRGHARLALISQGSRKQNAAKIGKLLFGHFLLQEKQEVWEAYQAAGTPAAVLLGSDGRIASPVALGAEDILGLAAMTINEPLSGSDVAREGLRQGDLVPSLVFPDLGGKPVSLTQMRRNGRLLIFWSPACSFCRDMVGDVNEWQRGRLGEMPEIVVISSGSVEDNQRIDLESLVMVDRKQVASKMFGARGTPMAVFLSKGGRVSSKIAAGKSEITALLSDLAVPREEHSREAQLAS